MQLIHCDTASVAFTHLLEEIRHLQKDPLSQCWLVVPSLTWGDRVKQELARRQGVASSISISNLRALLESDALKARLAWLKSQRLQLRIRTQSIDPQVFLSLRIPPRTGRDGTARDPAGGGLLVLGPGSPEASAPSYGLQAVRILPSPLVA